MREKRRAAASSRRTKPAVRDLTATQAECAHQRGTVDPPVDVLRVARAVRTGEAARYPGLGGREPETSDQSSTWMVLSDFPMLAV